MAANRKKTNIIRNRKKKPNKANLRANQKRITKNAEILKKLASESPT